MREFVLQSKKKNMAKKNSVSPIGVGSSLFFMAFVVLWSISIFMIGILIARKWVQLYLMLRSGSVQEDALHPLCIEATKHAWINRIASVRRSTFESIGEKFQFSISEMDLLRFNGTALKQIICHPIHHEIKLLALIHYGIDRLYVFFFSSILIKKSSFYVLVINEALKQTCKQAVWLTKRQHKRMAQQSQDGAQNG